MQGEYETSHLIDLGNKRNKTKKQVSTATYISVLSGIIALDGLTMFSNPEAAVAATTITLTGVISSALFAKRASLKKEEYQRIQNQMEFFRNGLVNQTSNYHKTDIASYESVEELPIIQVLENTEETKDQQKSLRR